MRAQYELNKKCNEKGGQEGTVTDYKTSCKQLDEYCRVFEQQNPGSICSMVCNEQDPDRFDTFMVMGAAAIQVALNVCQNVFGLNGTSGKNRRWNGCLLVLQA